VRAVALMLTAVLAGLAGASAADRAAAVSPEARGDLDLYFETLEQNHPNPYHATPEADMRAAAERLAARFPALDDDQALVELMRLVALLGERDGHAGVPPLSTDHHRPMHLYPFYAYDFGDGVYVVAAVRRPDLVGARVVAVEGRPLAELMGLLAPLVTYDNELSRKLRVPLRLATAEVLHGLGVAPTARSATFTFELPSGERRDVTLEPLAARDYVIGLRSAFGQFVYGLPARRNLLFPTRRGSGQWLRTLRGGRVVYLAYNSVLGSTTGTARRLRRLAARRKVTRVVVDLRNNGGGDIGNYPPLLAALRSRAVNRPNRLVVLIGRATFSAATHFAADVDRLTRAVLIGEPTGGSPNHWSDTVDVTLPVLGWTVHVPTIYYEKRAGEHGLAIEPDIHVDFTAADFFGGRDPVLAAALALPRRSG
jgi:hypothetical protein